MQLGIVARFLSSVHSSFPAAESRLLAWAEFCTLGRGSAVSTTTEREGQRRATQVTDPLFAMIDVEAFFEIRGNMQFRGFALEAYGRHGNLGDWIWYAAWDPPFRRCLRQGWGWVKDRRNPLPEVGFLFALRFLVWHIEHPVQAVLPILPEIIGDRPLSGDDRDLRLISIRVAHILLEHEFGQEVPIRTVRDWCAKGRFEGAKKEADWIIPYGSVKDFVKPRRGPHTKKVKKKAQRPSKTDS